MKTISHYVLYLYYPIIAALIIVLVILLVRLVKTMRVAFDTVEKTAPINENLEKMSTTLEEIKASKASWEFFVALAAALSIFKEVIKWFKGEESFSKAASKILLRNSTKLKGLK